MACAIVCAVAVADMAGCVVGTTALTGITGRIVGTAALTDFGNAIVSATAVTDLSYTVICATTFAGNGSRCDKRGCEGCDDKRQIGNLGHGVSPVQYSVQGADLRGTTPW